MKTKNIVQHQMDLVEWFWNRGWACFKGDMIGVDDVEDAYVIAIKNGKVVLLNIQVLKSGNSKIDVSEESNELLMLKSRMEDSRMLVENDMITGFAVRRKFTDIWNYAVPESNRIAYKDNYPGMTEVVER